MGFLIYHNFQFARYPRALQDLTFGAHGWPIVSSVQPLTAPSAGGTLISLHGPYFAGGDDYKCRFGANRSVVTDATHNPKMRIKIIFLLDCLASLETCRHSRTDLGSQVCFMK